MTQNNLHKIELLTFFMAVAVLGAGLYFLGPSITGFVIKESSYSKDVDLVITSSGNYTLELDGIGELKSLKLDGKVTSYGKARVYIESNGTKYLVFDSARLSERENEAEASNDSNLITGFAAGNDEDEDYEDRGANNSRPDWTSEVDEFIINGTALINLSQYFTDEDNDALTYAASPVDGLEVAINGEIAAIKTTSDQDFNTTITFTASDGIGSKNEVVGLIVYAATQPIRPNNAPIWNSNVDEFIINGAATIDLSKYFIDEDNDTLSFGVSDAADIEEKLDNNILTLNTSKENFSATITITASDYELSSSKDILLIIPPAANETANQTINETIPINESNETINKNIIINLSYNKGTVYDANDNGEESVNGVVDLTIANTKFGWSADESKLCARWELYNEEEGILTKFCNGNNDCCSLFEVLPAKPSWSEVYYSTYGKDGAGHDNLVSAQIIYYDVNLTIPKSEIYISDFGNLSVRFFEEEAEFFDECLDTCLLSGLNKSSYTLVFEIEDDAVLWIDKISYSAAQGINNNPPVLLKNFSTISIIKNRNAAINLSEYFADADNDKLAYSMYQNYGVAAAIEGDIATIMPDKNFTGEVFTFFAANDTEHIAISNIFRISVAEINWENITDLLQFRFNDGETTKISYHVKIGGQEAQVPFSDYARESKKFGLVFDQGEIQQEIDKKEEAAIFDKRIFYEIESTEDYGISDAAKYALERNITGMYKSVTNQIGQNEARQLKRFLIFDDILSKESNLYEHVNGTKREKNFSVGFAKQGRKWLVEFYNLFDLDPSFVDETDSDWDSGTFNNMERVGIGADANLTSSGMNVSGSYASRIFDAGEETDWASMTIEADAHYGIEIRRAKDDSTTGMLPAINTSGLLLLMHFNNETRENGSLFYDFSEEGGSNNGACYAGRCPSYNFTNKKLGQGSAAFDGVDDYINLSGSFDTMEDFTFSAWLYWKGLPTSAYRFQRIFDFGNSTDPSPTAGQYMFLTPSGSSKDIFMFAITKAGYLNNYGVNSTSSLPVNQWVHVAVTLNGNASTLYRNGAFDAAGLALLSPRNISPVHNWLGRSKFTTDPYFNGAMDEIALWNRSLSPDEIKNIYLRGAARLNVSARSCDDSRCSGEKWKIQPANITSGYSIPLNLTTERYFQYNITYSTNATGLKVAVKNVSIEFASNESSSIIMDIDSEVVGIDSYIEADAEKIPAPAKVSKSNRTFGFIHKESKISSNLGRKGISRSLWDNKIYMSLNASGYNLSQHNPFMLERKLAGQFKEITNEIGQKEQRPLKRFIDFSAIFGKDANLFNYTPASANQTRCVNETEMLFGLCTKNYTYIFNYTKREERIWNYKFMQGNKSWIVEFFNMFDLDPSFIDDTDSNWDLGTFSKMFRRGTGATANLSANNISGHFASQVFDSVNPDANWTNISIVTEAAYGIEIGRYLNDSNLKETIPTAINTSGLIGLYHFNNETEFGETNTNVNDFSIKGYDATCTSCPDYNSTIKAFGKYAATFKSGNSDLLNIGTDTYKASDLANGAVSLWIYVINSPSSSQYVYDFEGWVLTQVTNNGKLSCCSDGGCTTATSITTISGSWHNMVCSWTGSSTAIYIDGNLEQSVSNSGSPLLDSTNRAQNIGSRWLDSQFLDGTIDEFAIWNRTLSASEIKNLYLRGAWRINLSVRTCDDSACAGESWSSPYSNITNGSKQSLIDLNLAKNRYFQYNITYSNFSAYAARLNVNNVSIEFVNATDSCSCPPSGDWAVNMEDNCVITSDCNLNGNRFYTYGTGTLTINALIYNYQRPYILTPVVSCHRIGGCFG